MVRQVRIPAAEARWIWDGRDDSGAPLPPGVYVLETDPGVRAKVVKLERWASRGGREQRSGQQPAGREIAQGGGRGSYRSAARVASETGRPISYRKSGEKSAPFSQTTVSMSSFTRNPLK
jgi:hypothetical protein